MFKFSLKNWNQAKAKLNAAAAEMTNMDKALNEIGGEFLSFVQQGFKGQRDPYRNRWKMLTKTTISRRRKGSSVVLQDTGRLKRSFSYRVQGNRLTLGSPDKRSRVLHYGAKRGKFGSPIVRRRTKSGKLSRAYRVAVPWCDIPSRKMIPVKNSGIDLPPEWRKSIDEILKSRIMGQVR